MVTEILKVESYSGKLLDEVSGLLTKSYLDNPMNVRVFGKDVGLSNEVFFKLALQRMKGTKLVIKERDVVLGFIHWAKSPNCQFSMVDRLKAIPICLAYMGLDVTLDLSRWLSIWSANEPSYPHVHLGPIAVDPEYQGLGIGTQLMERYCMVLDEQNHIGYLETDVRSNIAFYEKFGFHVREEINVLGVPNYLMRRG